MRGVGVNALLLGLVGVGVGEGVAIGELDGVAGQAEETLVVVPGGAGHLLPLGGKAGAGVFREGDAGVRGPGAGGAEGARLGRAVLGVDGDGSDAGALGQDGGGQAESSAADDGNVGLRGVAAGEGEIERDGSGAPGERPAGAAVAVVVDDELVAYPLGFDAWALGAEGPGADGDFEEAVFVGADGGERGDGVVEGKRGYTGGADGGSGAAGGEAERGDGSRGLEEVTPVHTR